MKGLKVLVLLSLLCGSITARASDYLFTWHVFYPQLQQFQGTFMLTEAEMQPDAIFGSELFFNSISITGPDGVKWHGNDPVWDHADGQFGPPLRVVFSLHDDSHSLSLSMVAGYNSLQYYGPNTVAGSFLQFFPDSPSISEQGWWSYQQVPEPSAVSLLALGAGAWIAKRKRSRLPQ